MSALVFWLSVIGAAVVGWMLGYGYGLTDGYRVGRDDPELTRFRRDAP